VRLPLGFGKKGYFTLASIQASTIEYKTKRQHARLLQTTRLFADTCEPQEVEDDPPPLDAALLGFVSSYRPRLCKCSRLFAKRAHSAIKRAKKRRKCNCHCRYFSFRRSGIHPPQFSSFIRQTSKARSTTLATMALKLANIVGRIYLKIMKMKKEINYVKNLRYRVPSHWGKT